MEQTLLEKHETLVVEIGKEYLGNMEIELGKKYKQKDYEVNPSLTDSQYNELKTKHNIESNDFADIYSEFMKMSPTEHLQQVMEAFSASGGNVDIEPYYDETNEKLVVPVNFVIKDNKLERIEGLTPIEELFLKMNAMLQVESVLADSGPDQPRPF